MGSTTGKTMRERPNVILITTDQQRFDGAGIQGSPFLSTPSMDRLGREGVRFARSYCPNGVCTPSRVSLVTGLHLSRHGSYNIGVHPRGEGEYLSILLRRAGYQAHHVGKAHWHPWDDPPSREYGKVPLDQCDAPFHEFAGFETAEICVGHAGYNLTAHYGRWVERQGHDPRSFKPRFLFPHDPNGTGEIDLPVALHSGTWLAERAVRFLETRDPHRPFFLNLGFPDPHHPHLLPAEYERRIDPDAIPPPLLDLERERNAAPHLALFRDGTLQDSRFRGRFEMAGQGRASWGAYWSDLERSKATRANYYGMIHIIDDQLGTILAALDALDLARDTLVVFTSDHGEMLGITGSGRRGRSSSRGC